MENKSRWETVSEHSYHPVYLLIKHYLENIFFYYRAIHLVRHGTLESMGITGEKLFRETNIRKVCFERELLVLRRH